MEEETVVTARKVPAQMVLVTPLKVAAAGAREVMPGQEEKVNLLHLPRIIILRAQVALAVAAVVVTAAVMAVAVLVYLGKELMVPQEQTTAREMVLAEVVVAAEEIMV
jgi:hypothetical protein